MKIVALQLVALIREAATFIAFAAGLVLVAVGTYLLSPAAGFIVGGVLLAGVVVLYEIRPKRTDQ